MPGNRILQAVYAVAAGALALYATSLRASEVTVVLTKVDDGDAKHVQNGVHQDDNFTLLRQGSIPLTTEDPGRPVRIAVDRTRTFQTMCGHGAAMTDSSAWVLINLALDGKFGPTPRTDSEAAGLVIIRTDNYQEAKFEREFYGIAQMSRAARPGSKRVAASFQGADPGGMDMVAFALPNGQNSLVVFNKKKTEQSFQVEADGKFFDYLAPGHSIATFKW